MGYTMRTVHYRYTEWLKKDTLLTRELYNHQNDPDETRNVVNEPEYQSLIPELSLLLQKGRKVNNDVN